MNRVHFDKIQAISRSYLQNFKPLLEMLKVRNGNKYPQNCLNELRAVNDHIARCYRVDEMPDAEIDAQAREARILKEIGKAEGHLQRLGYDCYKQLIVFQVADIKHTVRNFYSSRWPRIGGGTLWDVYSDSFRTAVQKEREAKRQESIDSDKALRAYDEAYNAYFEILRAFETYKREIRWSRLLKFFERISRATYWLVVTVVLTLIAAIIGLLI